MITKKYALKNSSSVDTVRAKQLNNRGYGNGDWIVYYPFSEDLLTNQQFHARYREAPDMPSDAPGLSETNEKTKEVSTLMSEKYKGFGGDVAQGMLAGFSPPVSRKKAETIEMKTLKEALLRHINEYTATSRLKYEQQALAPFVPGDMRSKGLKDEVTVEDIGVAIQYLQSLRNLIRLRDGVRKL